MASETEVKLGFVLILLIIGSIFVMIDNKLTGIISLLLNILFLGGYIYVFMKYLNTDDDNITNRDKQEKGSKLIWIIFILAVIINIIIYIITFSGRRDADYNQSYDQSYNQSYNQSYYDPKYYDPKYYYSKY